MREVSTARGKNARRRESERIELLTVVLGHAQRQIDAAGQACQILPRQRGEAEERRIVGSEESGRRDVVILQDPAVVKTSERVGHR
jgi:hypothetical protein